eukprot:261001_1
MDRLMILVFSKILLRCEQFYGPSIKPTYKQICISNNHKPTFSPTINNNPNNPSSTINNNIRPIKPPFTKSRPIKPPHMVHIHHNTVIFYRNILRNNKLH